jgi:glycosyltransferase involved in cell wall biosynthesis
MKRLSIIVPYRNRAAHLRQFIPHMRSRFKDAEIVIVEQADDKPFNRAKLLNIGFLNSEADYFAMHDVDMLPMKADYSFPEVPTHIATRVSQFRYKMPFPEYFGGVTLFNRNDFTTLNGYSNKFFGWGGEDNEMYDHVMRSGMKVARRICTFESLHHLRDIDGKLYEKNCELWKSGRDKDDGLTHCDYEIIKTTNHADYYKISVGL